MVERLKEPFEIDLLGIPPKVRVYCYPKDGGCVITEFVPATERDRCERDWRRQQNQLVKQQADLDKAQQEIERLRGALEECTRLSGADLSGGFPTWPPLHEFAVQEVRQLRDDYDEALKEIPLRSTPTRESE